MPRTTAPLRPRCEPNAAPARVLMTRRKCQVLADDGLLDTRYELIQGVMYTKMGQKRRHALCLVLLHTWLARTFGPFYVQTQSPIDVAEEDNETNEPEPDATVLRQSATNYLAGNPSPREVVLIVEVADTSLRFDLRTKALLYARAGIPEYWVIDLSKRQIYVHLQPRPDGYTEAVIYTEGEEVAPLAKPDAFVRVGELLPPIMGEGTES